MKTKVINIIGAPSAGKSIFCSLIFAELKMMHYSSEICSEYVKHLIWKKEFETLCNQYYVTQQQYKMFKAINGAVEYIVTDGSLIHGLYYNRIQENNICDVKKTEKKIKEWLNEFENIYVFLERGDHPYEIGGRIHTEEQSKMIEYELQELLDELQMKYIKIKSSKSNVSKIIEYIMLESGKNESDTNTENKIFNEEDNNIKTKEIDRFPSIF